MPDFELANGITTILNEGERFPLQIFGDHNLQNMIGAKLVLNQIGITDTDFCRAMQSFKGAAKRLERIASNATCNAYKDFAHSPSKLKATVSAVKQQFPNRKLVACMELHTFSSLKKDFLPQYDGAMKEADLALVYYSPEVVAHKKLDSISEQMVAEAFGTANVKVYTDSDTLVADLRKMTWENSNLLLMSSGNFHGVDLNAFAQELIH